MSDKVVFDTSSLEHIGADDVVVPHHVRDEVEQRGEGEGLISESRQTPIDRTSQCVNFNLAHDIEKAASNSDKLDRRQKRDVAKKLKKAEKERSEKGRQTQLRRAHSMLPSSEVKGWNGQISGAKTDCSVIEAGKEVGEVITEDQGIKEYCEKHEDLTCRGLREE